VNNRGLALELELDRFEGVLAPELAAGARALVARARAAPNATPPPWPSRLRSESTARLARAAAEHEDPAVAMRGRQLARWCTAARLEAEPTWAAARATPRDLAGLGARHRAFAGCARRLGFAGARALADALHGPAPALASVSRPPAAAEPAAHRASAVDSRGLPDAERLLRGVAGTLELDTRGVALALGATPITVTLSPGHACAIAAPGEDALASLAVAMHELGHALWRAQRARATWLTSEPAARWLDEAVAAWMVRQLEQPTWVSDDRVRELAATRRQRREALTVRLARFELDVLDVGVDTAAAWAATELGAPDRYTALFDEPGVMASYHAADVLEPDAAERALRSAGDSGRDGAR
jgi:hypothetical protein